MEPKDNNSKKAVTTGIIAALAASSCCIPPVIAAIAGVGGAAGSLSWMEPLRPYLIVLAVVAIGYAWYTHLKPKTADDCGCEVDDKPKFYQTKGFLISITLFAALSITFPYYSGIFYPDSNKQEVIVADANSLQKIEVKISGMTCDACQHHVNSAINALPGIVTASSSYAEGNATVEFDNTKTTTLEIEEAINSTGYKVVETENKTVPHGEKGHVCGPNGCGGK